MKMDKDIFGMVTMLIVMGVLGIFSGVIMASDTADNRVVNQLCQKQLYDFCEIDRYKMKGDLK